MPRQLAMTLHYAGREVTLIYPERDLRILHKMLIPEGQRFTIAAGIYDNFTVAGGQDVAAWTEKPAAELLAAARDLMHALRAKPIPAEPQLPAVLWRAIELLEQAGAQTVFVRHHYAEADGKLSPEVSKVLSPAVSACFRAVRAGDVARIHELLLTGVLPEALNSEGSSLLGVAAATRRESAQALLELGANPNRPFTFRPRADKRYVAENVLPLMYARDAEMAALLLAHGALIDAQDGRGNTALMRAADAGRPILVEYLVKAGADTRIRQYRARGRKSHDALELAQSWLDKLGGDADATLRTLPASPLFDDYRRCVEILAAASGVQPSG